MSSITDISNPWKGLSSYTEGEIIYGRDKDIENLFTLITTNQEITILYGQSGIGKTSLLRAGLFPWLRSSHIFPVYVRLGHDESDKSYVEQVIETVENETQKYNIKQTDLASDSPAPKSLWEFLHRYDFHTESGEKCVPMIFFDQFEELFTISANRIKNVEEFIRDLGNVLNGTRPEYLIAPSSTELDNAFVKGNSPAKKDSDLDVDIDLDLDIDAQDTSSLKTKKDFLLAISIREDYIYHLDRISAAIPALKRNRYFLHGLDETGAREVIKCPVKNLVDNTVTNEIISVCHNADEKYISPAFISLLMYNLFERMQQKGQTTITSSLVSGSIGDIFYNYYVNSIKGLSDESIDFLEDRLISKGGFRLTVPVSDALAAGVTEGELKQLEDKRLIVRSKRGNNDFIELTHDLLCKEISKDKEERDKVKKSKKSRRRILILSCLVVLFFAISSLFIWQLIELNHRENAWLINQSRAVAAIADELNNNGDSYTATLLALEVLPEDINNPNRPLTIEAEGVLRRSLLHDNAILYASLPISSVAVSPDGKFTVGGLNDGSICLWDNKNGRQIWKSAVGHTSTVRDIAFSADGQKIATGSGDKNICLWDAKTGKQIGNALKGHSEIIFSVRFSPDGKKLASCSRDKTIRIWDVETGKETVSPLEGHLKDIISIAFSPDGKYIASSSEDYTIRIWDTETGQQIGSLFHEHDGIFRNIIFSQDGKRIISISKDKFAIWDASTLDKPGSIRSPNLIYLKELRAKDESVDKLLPIDHYIPYVNKDVYSLSFSEDGKRVIIRFYDDNIRIYDTETGEQIGETIEEKVKEILDFAIIPGTDKIAYISSDNSVHIWDIIKNHINIEKTPLKPNKELSGRQIYVFSPDNNVLLVIIGDDVALFDPKTGEQINKVFDGWDDSTFLATFNHNGNRIATAGWDNTIRIWDFETGKQICESLKGHTGNIFSIAFSPDGKRIASTSRDKTIRFWDAETGKQIGDSIKSSDKPFTDIAFSPDGKKIATSHQYGTIKIWDSEMKQQIGNTINLPFLAIYFENMPIQFSPDGKKVLFEQEHGGRLGYVDLESGNIHWLNGAEYLPNSQVLSSNSKYIITTGGDAQRFTINVNETETGKLFFEIPLPIDSNPPLRCAFSSDGNKIYWVNYLNVYSLDWKPLQQLIDEQRERFKDRKLTPEERRQYYLE